MTLTSSRHVALRFTLCLVIALVAFSGVCAQELIKDSAKPVSTSTEPTVNERVRLLESELERQNSKLDQLQKTIAEQQLTLKALLDKLSTEKSDAPTQASPQPIAASTTTVAATSPSTTSSTSAQKSRRFRTPR